MLLFKAFKQCAFNTAPKYISPLLAATPSAFFSEFFRERDNHELVVMDHEASLHPKYKYMRDFWRKGLERKKRLRERKMERLENWVQPEAEQQKLVIHNPAAGITYPPQDDQVFAIVRIAGTQHKVTKDDVLIAEWLKDYDINQQIVFDDVLLVATKDYTSVGRPVVETAKVYATVEEQSLSEKIIVFKKKRRKGYKRTKGHRQPITVLRIDKIEHTLPETVLGSAVSLV